MKDSKLLAALPLITVALGVVLLIFYLQSDIASESEPVLAPDPAPEIQPELEPDPEPIHELVGTWESATESMTLNADGTVTSPAFTGAISQAVITWYTFDFEEPKQFYLVVKADDGQSARMGSIYKVIDDKLYMRSEQVYERTLNGFSTGQITRKEMPTDFSADVTLYRKR